MPMLIVNRFSLSFVSDIAKTSGSAFSSERMADNLSTFFLYASDVKVH